MVESSNWRGPAPVGSHAYAREFARSHDVFWLGTALRVDQLFRGGGDVEQRRHVWRSGGETHQGISHYYPAVLLPALDKPGLRARWVAKHTLDLSLPNVFAKIKGHGFGEPDLLWLSQSRFSWPVFRRVRASKRVYRISDDWGSFGTIPRSLLELEREMIRGCDVVFATARRLAAAASELNDNVVYLPNGVDESFFSTGAPVPAALAQLPSPRAIFVGTVADWVDGAAIRAIARRRPDVSIVIAGPQHVDIGVREPNVHFVGAVPFTEVPAWLEHCDVALVPFKQNQLTHAVSPVKLFEYLAAGLPVVATRLDEIAASEAPVALCDTTADFAEKTDALLSGARPWRRDAAITFAREHTWTQRMVTIRKALGW